MKLLSILSVLLSFNYFKTTFPNQPSVKNVLLFHMLFDHFNLGFVSDYETINLFQGNNRNAKMKKIMLEGFALRV